MTLDCRSLRQEDMPLKRWYVTYWRDNEPYGPVLTLESRMKPTRVVLLNMPAGCTYSITGGQTCHSRLIRTQ